MKGLKWKPGCSGQNSNGSQRPKRRPVWASLDGRSPVGCGEELRRVLGTSLVVQWLGLCLPLQTVQIQSLVRKLRSHMPRGQKNNIKQKQCCNNKFNKDFKYDPHIKKKVP